MDAGLILLEGVAFLSLFRVCVPELVEGRRVLWCCRFRRGLRRFRRLGRRFFGCGSLSPVDLKLLFLSVRGTVRVTVLRRIRFFLVLGRRFAVPPTLALAGSVALSGILGLLPLGLPSLPVVDADSVRRPVEPAAIEECIHDFLRIEHTTCADAVQVSLDVLFFCIQYEPVPLSVRKPPEPQEVQDARRLEL